ncbi:DNA mismatch repair protein MutT [Labrys miyagiensis]
MKTIRIAAALILRGGETLLVRKRGSVAFMQPGGKIEDGEGAVEALVRELHEEVGLAVAPKDLVFFGRFEAVAANELDHRVDAEIFRMEIGTDDVTPAAEIEEVRWVSIAEPGTITMAPLTGHQLLPALRRMLQAVS